MNEIKTNWLDPLNKFKIHQAVRNNQPQVRLRDNRLYHLTYEGDRVFIAVDRTHGFAPRGWFRLDDILHHTWLKDGY